MVLAAEWLFKNKLKIQKLLFSTFFVILCAVLFLLLPPLTGRVYGSPLNYWESVYDVDKDFWGNAGVMAPDFLESGHYNVDEDYHF